MTISVQLKATIILCLCVTASVLAENKEPVTAGGPAGKDKGVTDALRYEKDFKGQEWALTKWKDGTRPYPKDLKKREDWYRERNGEDWKGKLYRWGRNTIFEKSIMSPGVWAYEVYWMDGMMKHYRKGPGRGWTAPNPQVFSPGGQEVVSDMYLITP